MERLRPSLSISSASAHPMPRGHFVLWGVQVEGPQQCCLCGLYQTRSSRASSTVPGSAMRRIGGGLLLRGMPVQVKTVYRGLPTETAYAIAGPSEAVSGIRGLVGTRASRPANGACSRPFWVVDVRAPSEARIAGLLGL